MNARRSSSRPKEVAVNRGTYETQYGHVVIGEAFRVESCWKRNETYTPKNGGKPVAESRWANGPHDLSAGHHMYPTGYDPKCSWCYLGHAHTAAAHKARIGGT